MSEAMTTDKRDRLAELVQERDRLEAWLKAHPPHPAPPTVTSVHHQTAVRYKHVWTEWARAVLDLRERWGAERGLIPADLDADQIDDVRWGMSGALRGREMWGQSFTLSVVRWGTRAARRQPPGEARRERELERSTYAWLDAFRALDEHGHSRPAVVVAHAHDPDVFERKATQDYGLVVERLPWSWSDPLNCTAIAASRHGLPARRADRDAGSRARDA